MPTPWPRLVFACTALLQCAEACVDSSGNFFCATLWYFWFGLFWFFMFLFIGTVCIVNRCKRHKRQVDIQIRLPKKTQNAQDGHSEAQSSTRTEVIVV